MTKHQIAVSGWILLATAAILVSLFAPGIWTTGSVLFLVYVCGWNHMFKRVPKI